MHRLQANINAYFIRLSCRLELLQQLFEQLAHPRTGHITPSQGFLSYVMLFPINQTVMYIVADVRQLEKFN